MGGLVGWKQPNDERIAEIRRRVAELDTLIAKHDKTHAADLGTADTPEGEYCFRQSCVYD